MTGSTMSPWLSALAASVLCAGCAQWQATAADPAPEPVEPAALVIGHFSAASPGSGLPPDWAPLTFPSIARHTRYRLVAEPTGVVLRADAESSASALMRELTVDLARYSVIEWRWRVDNVLARSDIRSREGDDYPARLYVTFAHDESSITFADRVAFSLTGRMPPRAAINYVWDTKSPVGTVVPNAYTDRVRMIVVESGTARVGQWVSYHRNLAEDFRKAFGYEAPPMSSIAVMTDTDNTGESATAFYGDIVLQNASTRAPGYY